MSVLSLAMAEISSIGVHFPQMKHILLPINLISASYSKVTVQKLECTHTKTSRLSYFIKLIIHASIYNAMVKFIKFPDFFYVVIVILYFQLILNEISLICFTIILFTSYWQLLFIPSDFRITFSNEVKPKQMEFLAQMPSCVLLSM